MNNLTDKIICCLCKEEALAIDPECGEFLCVRHNNDNNLFLQDKGSNLKGIAKCRVDICPKKASAKNLIQLCTQHYNFKKKHDAQLQ